VVSLQLFAPAVLAFLLLVKMILMEVVAIPRIIETHCLEGATAPHGSEQLGKLALAFDTPSTLNDAPSTGVRDVRFRKPLLYRARQTTLGCGNFCAPETSFP
jgi:hypothetical protein